MYHIKHPVGLKQRIAFLGGFERALRLSLLSDGYRYVARNTSNVFYLVCFKDKPIYINGIFLKSDKAQNCKRINGEAFLFMKENTCLDLKTMETIEY